MPLKQAYKTAIILEKVTVKIYFSQNISIPLNNDLQAFGSMDGMKISNEILAVGKPWIIQFSPLYRVEDVAFEVEQILRKNNITDICIKLDTRDSSIQTHTLSNIV